MIEVWSLIAAGVLLFVPGYLLLRVAPQSDMDAVQKTVVAVVLGLALYPVLLLWATLAGLSWGGPTTWLMLLAAALIMVWTWPKRTESKGSVWLLIRQNPHYVLFALILLASLAVRLVAIRGLEIPSWGDSLHHSWISRLIAERGQVPDSYFPYFPLDSLTYHFGFHSMVAFFSWVSGLEITRSVLVLGQILNALSAATIYVLTRRLTGNHAAALVSALVAGLVSLMPGYYVNWGRYTQLAGQVILPVAAVLAIDAMEKRHWGYLALASLAAAGLFLTHYRVILFYVALLAAYMAWNAWRYRALSSILRDARWLAGIGALALALVAPRVWYLAVNLPKGEASVPQLSEASWDAWMVSYNQLGDVSTYVSWPLLVLGVIAFLAAVWRRHAVAPVMGVWVVILFLMANVERMGIGRGAWLNNFAILIALYIPVSILVGWLAGAVLSRAREVTRLAPYALAGLAIAAGVWGARSGLNVVDNQYVIATLADQRAMKWVSENTSRNARFLVNSFFAYGDRFVVGSDGGWWMSYLSGRDANVPIIMYGAESSPGRDYAAKVNALARSLQQSVYTPEGVLLMKDERISHIFIGEKGGSLDPARLLSAGHQAVYRDGPVWVFKVNYSTASARQAE